jgi:hypothetical protein
MPSRAQLELRARVVGITSANYPNDSVLEQRVVYQEKQASTVAGALATSTLTSNGTTPSAADTVTIGNRTYTFVTALTEVAATLTATLTANPAVNDTLTIGSQTYRFVSTLAIPNDVLIGAANTNTAANLQAAITAGGGAGTTYANGTTANTSVTATVSTNAVTAIAKSVGTTGNGLTATSSSANVVLSNGGLFTGGINAVPNQVLIGANAAAALTNLKSAIAGTAGAGTVYSSGTPTNVDVTAGTLTATTLVVNATQASVNNAATTKSAATLSWTGANLAGGSPTVVAPATLASSIQAESGGAQV